LKVVTAESIVNNNVTATWKSESNKKLIRGAFLLKNAEPSMSLQ